MLKTLHYKLKMFESGDTYLSTADRQRFTIIDNQISFLTDQIGDGVISGWDIIPTGGTNVRVLSGVGVIDRFVTETFGYYDFNLTDNHRWYFFIRRKQDVIADKSAFSGLNFLSYTDTTPPATPATPTLLDRSYNSISITWVANTEPDLAYYSVWRSDDGTSYGSDPIATTTTNSYIDNYKLASTDSNNLSNGLFSGVLNTSTLLDTRIPSDPINLDVINSNKSLQILWDAGAFLVDSYRIIVQPIDTEDVTIGSPTTYNVSKTTFYLILEGLNNGQNYRITVKSVSSTGIESTGSVVKGQPIYSGGPQEIESFIFSDFALDSSWNVAINLSWALQTNEYQPDPAYYIVTIEQGSEVGDPTIYLDKSIIIQRYTVGGIERKIREKTKYTIRVQTVDADGNHSEGYLIRVRTAKYSPPGPVTNFASDFVYTLTEKSITANWVNTTTEFAYNQISVTRTTLGTSPVVTVIESNRNIGQLQEYIVPKSKILNNCSYTFTIKAFDSYGNYSDATGGTTIVNVIFGNSIVVGVGEITGARPPVPDGLTSISGNDSVTINWNPVISDNQKEYRIWRADFTAGSLQPSDFVGLATTTKTKYTDYDVENGSAYFYFVTSIDVFGEESANPNDKFISYTFATGEPRNHSELSKPPVINVSASGNDAIITWQSDTDSFDGYEIWRSIGGKANFIKIATVDPFSTSYTDSNALYKSGEYWYMIRKFRDEAEFIVSGTKIVPTGSLLLGYVEVTNGTSTVHMEDKIDLALLIDPIKLEVKKQLQSKTHLYYGINDDRRIRLSDNLVVSDWKTLDFKNYTSGTDIIGTGEYIAYVNNLQTSVSSFIDRNTGTLTFEDYIYDPLTDSSQPEPTVLTVFTNTGEVDGILPQENIGSILADKITKGKLPSEALRQMDHFGRFREQCIPAQYPATRRSGNIYDTTTPSGIAFYDLIVLPSGRILAATPEGVRLTTVADGTVWDVVLNTELPCTKLYYSDTYSWYMAICGNEIYYSVNLSDWIRIPGISDGNIIRDIAEDASNNIYISCDSGVYRVNPNRYVKISWEQCGIIDAVDNSAYAITYDSGYITVSVSSGLYRTNNEGLSWTKSTQNELNVPVFAIIKSGSYTFLVSNNKIWRKHDGDIVYSTIASFPFAIRKIAIFAGDIYVTTDKGLYRSDPTQDIFTNAQLRFAIAFQSLQRNTIIPAVYALRNVGASLYMGLDERIYSANAKRKLSLHANVQGICPIMYVNGVVRNVGVYYSSQNAILFDTRQDADANITITRDYTTFKLINGGWADSKYDAELTLILNGSEQLMPFTASTVNGVSVNVRTPVKPQTSASYISQQTKQIITPFFNARTSNFNEAFKYLKQLVQLVDQIDTQALLFPDQDVDSNLLASVYRTVNLLKINLNPELADTIILPPIGGSATTANGISFDYDVVGGNITITTGVTKYTLVAFSIKGVGLLGTGDLTHAEIDDRIEVVNSGLPASFASVQQSNILKFGIYGNSEDPGALDNTSYQAKYFRPCDNWYNVLASTVDYSLKIDQGSSASDTFSISYPADVIYLKNIGEVWVCGKGGIISVNSTTYECKKIFASEFYFYNMALSEGIVYALAEDGLYLIDTATKVVNKNVDLDLPPGYSSVIQFGNTTYIATKDGLLFRRTFEPQWTKLFDIKNAFVRSGQQLTFAVGQDPNDDNTSLIYYSHSGVIWNRSTQLTGYIISGATQRGDSIFYATDKGLIVEDLSKLFSENGSGGPQIIVADLNGDDIPDEVVINAVDADDTSVFAVTADGNWYKMGGNYVYGSGVSRLSTIHKVKVVEGQYWFFADNLIDIQSSPRLIQLSTGKALI
jgi:fibronectin type 3 domain-containing protein